MGPLCSRALRRGRETYGRVLAVDKGERAGERRREHRTAREGAAF